MDKNEIKEDEEEDLDVLDEDLDVEAVVCVVILQVLDLVEEAEVFVVVLDNHLIKTIIEDFIEAFVEEEALEDVKEEVSIMIQMIILEWTRRHSEVKEACVLAEEEEPF